MQIERYIKTKGAGAAIDDSVVSIPSGVTAIIKMIDFTSPQNGQSGVLLLVNGVTVAAAQSDKVLSFPDGLQVVGPMSITLRLDNSNSSTGALLGVSIYYERLG